MGWFLQQGNQSTIQLNTKPLRRFSNPAAICIRINIGIVEKGIPLPNFNIYETRPESTLPPVEAP